MHATLALVALSAALLASGTLANPFGSKFSGDGTYYGFRDRGFGHCSFHFYGFGKAPGFAGTPLAINAAQYTGASICGLCVRYRGTGGGAGGNPIAADWQPGFICDQCPECKHGDIDLQSGGDGRWRVEWEAAQCPVGDSKFRYGFQGGNPWYKKIQIANARVPVRKLEIKRNGAWQELVATIDNHHEYHGTEPEAFNDGGCATVRATSILGDAVEDRLCCTQGTCEGFAQLPCRSDMPGDCAGAPPAFGNGAGGGDSSNKRVPSGTKELSAGAQCGGNSLECSKLGQGACKDAPFARTKCGKGLKCVRNDARWWGCKKA
ncbi:MAG: hypothetical protein J3K34DRAFT_466209 [Monoraphidium minutum]|nr:MAG: hypothetical protein J3K34DRAFT_466209 [Monoraphidium minutum]